MICGRFTYFPSSSSSANFALTWCVCIYLIYHLSSEVKVNAIDDMFMLGLETSARIVIR